LYVGLTLSLVLHLSLLGWALVNFAGTPPLRLPKVEPVEVAIITDEDLVRLRSGDRASKNRKTRKAPEAQKTKKPAKKPARRMVRTAPPPPTASAPPPAASDPIADTLASLSKTVPAPAAKPKSKAESKPKPDPAAIALKRKREDAQRKAKAEAEAKKKAKAEARRKAAEAKKRAAERRKKLAEKRRREKARKRKLAENRKREAERKRKLAEKKKNAFDPRRISALLNKIPDQRSQPAGSPDGPDDKSLPEGPRAGAPEGKDTRLTSSQIAMIAVMMKQYVSRCWNINSGLEGASNLVVDIGVRLRPDGSIDGTPRVENMRSDPAFRDAADSAMRALMQCAPYDLPQKFYKGGWDHMVVTFDPQKMF